MLHPPALMEYKTVGQHIARCPNWLELLSRLHMGMIRITFETFQGMAHPSDADLP